MSGAVLPSQTSLNVTLGALLLGGFASAVLFGIFCQQCLTFLQRFTKEGAVLKYSVRTVAGSWLDASGLNHIPGLHVSRHGRFLIIDISSPSNHASLYVGLLQTISRCTLNFVEPNRTAAGIILVTGVGDVLVRSHFLTAGSCIGFGSVRNMLAASFDHGSVHVEYGYSRFGLLDSTGLLYGNHSISQVVRSNSSKDPGFYAYAEPMSHKTSSPSH
ncbi:uncharacterized protein PHACADRAFT_186469 [Phanerochaete carnosa HHB-10118-sp]|uniref:Uncharacterized protein n=1 Tax=Phanerochaete carnosa (strain HHB-10118-sp) TaxID=650164 RepID=K5UR35_PHACS|nr:uncharacterized protein PHACADRAFT_186469 [Phanerochaete carnosa HHB-10118-sp]EKM52291.1 hypothetical protein PHACADRAFT_186469 [Phanerochaete carnosa HHB-10118-sp]